MTGVKIRYSRSDDAKMLEFVYQGMKSGIKPCGNKLWELAFDRNLFPGHSITSMRDRFVKRLLKDLRLGGLATSFLITEAKMDFIKAKLPPVNLKIIKRKSRGLEESFLF